MAVTQPDPYERVLRFHCEHKEHGAATLLLELIGRQANLLLLRNDKHGEGRILECMHRHTPAQGAKDTAVRLRTPAVRLLLPGRLYVPPPAQEKLPPVDDGRPDYYERLAAVLNRPGKLAKVLVEAVGGLGPQAAREVAARAVGDPEAPATAANVLALVAALQALWEPLRTGRWQPGNLLAGEQIVGFAPYLAHGAGTFVPTATSARPWRPIMRRRPLALGHTAAGTAREQARRGKLLQERWPAIPMPRRVPMRRRCCGAPGRGSNGAWRGWRRTSPRRARRSGCGRQPSGCWRWRARWRRGRRCLWWRWRRAAWRSRSTPG